MVKGTGVPEGYKQTEVGVIPANWNVMTIEDFSIKVGSGITPTGGERVYKKEGRPFLRSQNVGWGTLLLNDIAFIDDYTHNTFNSTEIQENDVFLNITGASIGRSAIANERVITGNVNQHVCIIRVDINRIEPRYLNYFLLSGSGQKQINNFQAGGNRQGLNFGQVKSIQIPLPPTRIEQTAIATALYDADALITQLEKLIAKKRNIKQGAMQELLKPKEGWVIEPLGKYVKISSGESPSKFEFNDFGIPYFKVEQLNNSEKYVFETPFQINTNVTIPKGSIIFPKRGASIFLNKIRILKEDSYMDTNLMTLTVSKEINNEYLFYQLSHIRLDKIADTTSIPQLNNKHINPFLIPLPATKNEQMKIIKILSDMDTEIEALIKKLEKYKALKQGMMQELLTGKTRLV